MTQEALKRVAEKLRRTGASIPAPEVTGTIEGSVVTGLCIALALVEGEIEALAQEKALQALHNENERLGLYRDAYAQRTEHEPVGYLSHNKENFVSADDVGNSVPNWTDYYPTPLYTHPPQRTWVGLTPHERMMCRSFYPDEAVAKTEAKLKEKNA